MFVNQIQNSIARHVLARIHAERLAYETKCKYVLAATVAEGLNWCNRQMNRSGISDKEYNCIHKLYEKFRKTMDVDLGRMIYDDEDGIWQVRTPDGTLAKVWSEWRKKQHVACACNHPRSCPQCQGWNG